jgi:phytoene desaturase
MGKKTVAVIGSGFGGLAAAIRLQAGGMQTTIFEKRDQPGGRAYVYRDHGFTFDAGPTVITAPHCIEELFSLAGKKMEDYLKLLPVEPFYRLQWEDGFRFDYGSDLEETLAQIREKSPRDAEGYLEFLKYSRAVFDEGYTRMVHKPFLDWWSMIRVSPQLARLRAYQSVYSAVSRFIKDPHLRQAFSFHSLLVGGNPFATSSVYTLIHYLERNWGVSFPVGGTGALVRALVKLFEDLGGKIVLNAPVEAISTANGRVNGLRLKGEFLPFDHVVSNADVVHTYRELLKGEPLVRSEIKRVTRMKQSMSLFLIYFGTNRTFPEIAHHTVLFGPRYRELLNDIFRRGVLAEDFSLYLHAPTRTDPSLAPPGCETFYVLAPVPHLGHESVDWSQEGEKYKNRILSYLERECLPGLRDSIVTSRIFTPEDFSRELNSHQGSAFSFEPLLTQSAYFRAHNRDRHLPNLYFVGAGTHPGAGLPGVINSGKATASVLLESC